MDAMEEIRRTFFEECQDELAALDRGLAAMEAGTADAETIAAAFRAVHSVKGGAGAFELHEIVRFALTFETVLRRVKDGQLAATAEMMPVLREAAAILRAMLLAARDRKACAAALRAFVPDADLPGEDEETAPRAFEAAGEALPLEEFGFAPVAVDFDDLLTIDGEATWRIEFTPRADLYVNGNESARLIREVLALGTGSVACDTSLIPVLGEIEPEGAYLSWTIELTTSRPRGDIDEIFEFASFDCELTMERLDAPAAPSFEDEEIDPETAALLARLAAA